MRMNRFLRALYRDKPELFSLLFVCSNASDTDTKNVKVDFNKEAIRQLGLYDSDSFCKTLDISTEEYRMSPARGDALLGEKAKISRKIRQHLLYQWILKNENYIRLLLL